jgi:hypothetical protein
VSSKKKAIYALVRRVRRITKKEPVRKKEENEEKGDEKTQASGTKESKGGGERGLRER